MLFSLTILILLEAAILGMATLFIYIFRRRRQALKDRIRVTYRLLLPPDLNLETAALAFLSLTGVFNNPGPLPNLYGEPSIVFEILGTPGQIYHCITFPPALEASIRGHLCGVIPQLRFEELARQSGSWEKACELGIRESEQEPQPKLIGALLSSFWGLEDGEAVLVQFVLASVNRPSYLSGDEPTFRVLGRLATRGNRAEELGDRVIRAYRPLNVFHAPPTVKTLEEVTKARRPSVWGSYANSKTLAVVCAIAIDGIHAHGLAMDRVRHLPPAPSIPSAGIPLGTATYPGAERPVAVSIERLMSHEWILGRTEQGKSTFMLNQAVEIMKGNNGLVLIEPDGRLAEAVLNSVPDYRMDDVIWFDPTDDERPIGFNLLQGPKPELTAGNIVHLFKGLYGDSWGPRLEQILYYSTLTAALNGLTIYDVKQLLVNQDFRERVLKTTDHPEANSFWRRLEEGPDNAIDAVLNKLDAFLRDQRLRNIVGQAGGLDIRDIVRKGKILLAPLPSEDLGASNAALLGSTLVSRIWSEVRLRQDGAPIVLMLDEWQHYVRHSGAYSGILDEGRKYKLGLVGASQRIDQLSDSMLSAVEANALTKVCFNVSPQDARRMAAHFPPLEADNIAQLPKYLAAMAVAVNDGVASAVTVRTHRPPTSGRAGQLGKEHSRIKYGVLASDVEAAHQERHRLSDLPDRPRFGRRSE